MAQIEALERLASTGLLKQEPPSREEIAGLLGTAAVRLEDARKTTNAPESRFDLAYNAAHALALAALRHHGYRSENRYLVSQTLAHTVALPPEQWRVLEAAHRKRNAVEYEGLADIDEQTTNATIRVAAEIRSRLSGLRATRRHPS